MGKEAVIAGGGGKKSGIKPGAAVRMNDMHYYKDTFENRRANRVDIVRFFSRNDVETKSGKRNI